MTLFKFNKPKKPILLQAKNNISSYYRSVGVDEVLRIARLNHQSYTNIKKILGSHSS